VRATRHAAPRSPRRPLPRCAVAQVGQRPVLAIAVQKISNPNMIETPREQSNVGFRISGLYAKPLINIDGIGDLASRPGLATAWRRLDERTIECDLRQGVRCHDGTPMTAEGVAFSFGERLFGTGPERAAMREDFDQVRTRTPGRGTRDRSNTSLFGDPAAGMLRAFGAQTAAERNGEWAHEAFNLVSEAPISSPDMAQRRAVFRRLPEIAEREDPADLARREAAGFTAKRRDIAWRAAKGWPMDCGPDNFRPGA
jgi:hypothetical protein